MDKELLQKEFNRLTSRGIILGLAWILGAGSVIALISAQQANKIYIESGSALEGKDKIRKCIVIGVGGLLIWVIALAIIIIFKKN